MDEQGWLPSGVAVCRNDTERPEPVLTVEQWREIADSGAQADDE